MAQTTPYELNLRDYWRILRKRKFLILITFCAIVAVTFYHTRRQVPVYEASADIKIEQRQTLAGALLESSIPWSVGDPMESMAKIIESRPIAEETARHIGLVKEGMGLEEKEAVIRGVHGAVSTIRVGTTNLIRITATHTDGEMALMIANGTAEVFVQWDLREKNKQARKLREFIENQLATVEKQLRASEEKLKAFKETEVGSESASAPLTSEILGLKTQLAELLVRATEKHPDVIRLKERIAEREDQLRTIPGGETEYARLQREVRLNEQLYTLFKQKFEEARIAEAEKVSDVSIVEYAKLPTSPRGGGQKATLFLGGLIGLLVGLVAAFFAENLDTSLSTIEGVETLLAVPVLAVIPHATSNSSKKKWPFPPLPWVRKPEDEIDYKARLIVHDQPKSAIAEAYRNLRTNLKFSEGITGKSLIISSSGPQEGKSTVLINLGLTTAQMGVKTLVVDSDLRRPSVYKTFRLKREPGLYEVLTGGSPWQEMIQGLPDILLGGMTLDEASKTPGLDHFFILPSGRIPLTPSELLGSREMDILLEELRKHFDVVLYDSPPILPVTDASLLAPKVDGVVIVYEIGKTARGALLRAKQQIESVGGKVLGLVLNHIKPQVEAGEGYPYYHYKYYGGTKKEETQERAARR